MFILEIRITARPIKGQETETIRQSATKQYLGLFEINLEISFYSEMSITARLIRGQEKVQWEFIGA